jgi:hypothetical protein
MVHIYLLTIVSLYTASIMATPTPYVITQDLDKRASSPDALEVRHVTPERRTIMQTLHARNEARVCIHSCTPAQ